MKSCKLFKVGGLLFFMVLWFRIDGYAYNPDMANNEACTFKPWYSFTEIYSLMTGWLQKYPNLTKFDTIEISQGKRPVYQFSISGVPANAPRQRFFLNGACHGNEKIGTEVCMRIMTELLEKYSSDQKIKAMVDRSEFVFHPVVNPDGFNSGSQGRRTLNNGKDPNRAYGYKTGGKNSDGSLPYQWPEIKAYLRCMVEAPWYLNFDYHCGIISLMTPDNIDKDAYSTLSKLYPINGSPDDEMVADVSDASGSELVRGGGLAMTGAYGKCGSIAFLPELCNHYPPENTIDRLTDHNMKNVFKCVEEMQKGVCGRLFDVQTNAPVYGQIMVEGKGSFIFSDPRSGGFFKYIPSPSGTFEVSVFANGYKPEKKSIAAVSNGFAKIDFPLTRDPSQKSAGLSVDCIGVGNSPGLAEVRSCLLPHDGKGLTIKDGFVVVDFGPLGIKDKEGNDITVYATNSDAYTVSVSDDPGKAVDGGTKIGEGKGQASFDLKSAGVAFARWVRIDATSGSPVIDAIEAEPPPTRIVSADRENERHAIQVTAVPGMKRSVMIQSFIPAGMYSVGIYNLKGKEITSLGRGITPKAGKLSFIWSGRDLNGYSCSVGAYVVIVQNSAGIRTLRVPMLWR